MNGTKCIGSACLPRAIPVNCSAENPSIIDTFRSSRRNTLRHVPKASRHNAGQLLSLLLNDFTAKPEELDNWTRLMLFAFCCLDAPKRGGKKHTKSLRARINAKVREFHTNKLMRPEADPSTPKIESKRKQKPQELSELVSAKIEEGDLKGAIRLASSAETMAPNDKATLLLLRSKHPVSPANTRPSPLQASDAITHISTTPGEIRKVIESFPAGSAAGPTGLRPQILKELTSTDLGDAGAALLQSLSGFSKLVLSGGVPEDFRPFFFGANLFAFSKPKGVIRPIAVWNTLRRLVAKCAQRNLLEKRVAKYGVMQFGCGIPRGCEAASHAMRHYIQDTSRHRNRVLLKVDMSNAFNSLRRDVLLETSQREHPEAYAFTLSAYGKPSWLFYGNEVIPSSEGVQQGDPEGPPLFSDDLMDIVEGVTSEMNEWYLDDGNIADEADVVLNDFRRLIVSLANMGLQINSLSASSCS